jgi:hypothetical protein
MPGNWLVQVYTRRYSHNAYQDFLFSAELRSQHE